MRVGVAQVLLLDYEDAWPRQFLGVADELRAALAAAGYAYRPEHEADIPDRRTFTRPLSAGPRIHLHAVVRGGVLWRQHLHFRDRLRQDARLRVSYGALKRALALQHAADEAACTEAKAPFIQAVLASGSVARG